MKTKKVKDQILKSKKIPKRKPKPQKRMTTIGRMAAIKRKLNQTMKKKT